MTRLRGRRWICRSRKYTQAAAAERLCWDGSPGAVGQAWVLTSVPSIWSLVLTTWALAWKPVL